MSAIRRFLAVLLLPPFALLLVVTLVSVRTNQTLLDPTFYTTLLERVDAYEFFYEAVLPRILERAGLDVARAPSSLGLSADGLSAKLKRVIPPETLESEVRATIESVLPYLAGEASSFELTLEPGVWVADGAQVARDLVREPELVDYVVEDMLGPPLESHWNEVERSLPLALGLTPDDVLQGVKTVCSGPWLPNQVDAFLDGFVPYLTGKTEGFAIHLELDEGVVQAIEVVRGFLHRALEGEAYETLIRDPAVTRLRYALSSGVRLPYEITFTEEEIGSVVAPMLPREWASSQLDRGIDAFEAYLTGRADTAAFSIPLGDRVEAAANLLGAAAEVKARTVYEGLPECTALERPALAPGSGVLPSCRIPGLDYEKVRAEAGVDLAAVLRRELASRLPQSLDLSDGDVAALFNRSTLEDLRRTVMEGYRLGPPELRYLLESGSPPDARQGDSWEEFQRLRIRLRDGIRVNEGDLRRSLDQESLAAFARFRQWLGYVRLLHWLTGAAAALLVVVIVKLAGRSRDARLLWGGASLLLGGASVVGAALVVEALGSLATPFLSGMATKRPMTDKLLELRDAAVSTFSGPLIIQGFVVSLAGIALILIARGCRKRRGLPPPSFSP